MRRASSRLRSSPGLVLLVVLLVGLGGLAQAQKPETARQSDTALLQACQASLACNSHLRQASELYEQNAYTAALDEYQAAYVLQPYPPILYNIARIHHKQGQLSDAMVYYQRYLASGHAQMAERVKQLLSEVQQALDAQEARQEPPPEPLRSESPPILSVSPPPAPVASRRKKPIYKQWWFWTIIGVAAVGAATAAGLGAYVNGPDVSGLPVRSLSFGK